MVQIQKFQVNFNEQNKNNFYLALAFIFYKGFVAFQDFEIGVDDRVADIEEKADFEKEGEVIGIMMYLGDPPKLYKHLLTKNKQKNIFTLLIKIYFSDFTGNFSAQTGQKSTILMKVSWCEIKS